MHDTITILGRVGSDPNRNQTTSGVPVISFRVASPQRRYDSKSGGWVETGTNWYTVSAYRQLAEHAKASLRLGDGVIVTGRLKLREWESGGRKGMSADIDADTIGHDLRWGASAFVKAPNTAATTSVPYEAPTSDDRALAHSAGLQPTEQSIDEDIDPEHDDDVEAPEPLAFAGGGGDTWAQRPE